jgi:dTDP-4-amino-4,6-dideoxygalactose transaminase
MIHCRTCKARFSERKGTVLSQSRLADAKAVSLLEHTFVADINVVQMVGATPILADCTSYDDWNISPEGIAAAITPRTKAVLIVHYAGFACDMDAIAAAIREKSNGRYIVSFRQTCVKRFC